MTIISNKLIKEMKDINSSYFIERKMRSGHLYGSKDIDRDLLEEINEEILNAIIL